MKSLKSAALAISLCLTSLSAWAIPIPMNFSFDGTITSATAANPFGLAVNEVVFVTGMDLVRKTGVSLRR